MVLTTIPTFAEGATTFHVVAESPRGSDPVDALIYWDASTFPGVVLPCPVIGMLCIEQNYAGNASHRIRNDRLLVVPVASRSRPR